MVFTVLFRERHASQIKSSLLAPSLIMKIMICTSRFRPDGMQTHFPPLGSMAIIQGLIKSGYQDTYLFDIDRLRPAYS